jgi:hypothetical protein
MMTKNAFFGCFHITNPMPQLSFQVFFTKFKVSTAEQAASEASAAAGSLLRLQAAAPDVGEPASSAAP